MRWKNSYSKAKRPKPEPIIPIENNEVRIVPYWFDDESLFALPLDWLLSLRLKQEAFIKDDDGSNYYSLPLKDLDKKEYVLSVKSSNLKRAFGLTTSSDTGIGEAMIHFKFDPQDEYNSQSIRVDLLGKHVKREELEHRLQCIIKRIHAEYDNAKERAVKCIAWTDKVEKMLTEENIKF
jgi:hypothetical protein